MTYYKEKETNLPASFYSCFTELQATSYVQVLTRSQSNSFTAQIPSLADVVLTHTRSVSITASHQRLVLPSEPWGSGCMNAAYSRSHDTVWFFQKLFWSLRIMGLHVWDYCISMWMPSSWKLLCHCWFLDNVISLSLFSLVFPFKKYEYI